VRCSEVFINCGATRREFVCLTFTDQDRPGPPKTRHTFGVVRWHVIPEERRTVRGSYTRRVNDVLRAVRDPVQRASVTSCRDLRIGRHCITTCRLARHLEEGAQLGVHPRDARQVRLDDLKARHLALPDCIRQIVEIPETQ
jgi:hypothetical protein